MTDQERDLLLAECLEDLHARRARGEGPAPGDYQARLGPHFEEFLGLLTAESAIDDAMAPPPPTELPIAFGEFTLVREIGRGSMGVVYEAVQRALGRKVAVKVLRTGFDTDEKALERFRREGRSCAQVRHDALVPLYDAGEVDGRPYYSMALLPGESLAALLRSGRAPKGRELFLGLAALADGLHALHEQGIVHRDVKPSNIIVEPSGRMVLTDFGLARSALSVSMTATGEALGTPLYMSPEAVLGRRTEIDGRTDVYSLGATLYEVLAGQAPFKTDDLQELMRRILHQRPRPLRKLAPDVPEDVERVVMTALEPRKEDRYASAAALRDALLALAQGRVPRGRPVSAIRHWLRAERRIWVPAVAALAVVGGMALWWSQRPGRISVGHLLPGDAVVEVAGRQILPGGGAVEFGPGRHAVVARREHFEEYRDVVELAPGETLPLVIRLQPKGEKGREVMAEAMRAFVDPGYGDPPAKTRGAWDAGVELLWPRGAVRRGDVAELVAYVPEVGPDLRADAVVELARGDEVLARFPVPPDARARTAFPIPAEVLGRLRAGDRLRWEVKSGGRFPLRARAEFQVVAEPPGLAAALARVDEWTGEDRVRRAELRALAYLKHGLAGRAWEEAWSALTRPGAAPDLGLAVAAYEAARRAGLEDSRYGVEARGAVTAFPAAEVEAFYAANRRATPR